MSACGDSRTSEDSGMHAVAGGDVHGQSMDDPRVTFGSLSEFISSQSAIFVLQKNQDEFSLVVCHVAPPPAHLIKSRCTFMDWKQITLQPVTDYTDLFS